MRIYSDSFACSSLTAFQQNFIREKMLFADIETTGLSSGRDQIYCIGCGYKKNSLIQIDLFFAETPSDEPEILKAFYELSSGFDTIVTFNGSAFDLPFIRKRTALLCPGLSLPAEAENIISIDLYREVTRLKNFLGLPSCRQKCVEEFLGCSRDDRYSGGELIHVYWQYVSEQDPELLHLLLLHNFEDVKGMFELTGILSYRQLSNGQFHVADQIREEEQGQNYLSIKIIPEFDFARSIHRQLETSALSLGQNSALIRFPLKHGTLKHFFPDPENYYYLPDEDTAIHKSVGGFVDPAHRKKATKRNCYIKKECDYITVPARSADSYLKQEYNERNLYLEIPAENNSCRDFLQICFGQYIR